MTTRSRCAIALRFVAATVWVLGALVSGCHAPARPNVLLVTFDTSRYDHFGATGDPEAQTPTVDNLAATGLLFERAYSSVSLTLPAHLSIMTGLEPLAHDVHNNGRFAASDDLETLAETLKATGYDTAAFVSAIVLDRAYNLDQGFDVYTAPERRGKDPLDFSVTQRAGSEVTEDAVEWLGDRGTDAPFFLWAHYYDPHQPREIVPPFDAMPDPYRAEIAYADMEFGKLRDAVANHSGDRDTLVIFTADHGESLGQHHEATHGLLAYDSTLHIPLILQGPGVPEGIRSKIFARHVDIVPTILAMLRIEPGAELTGRNLIEASRKGTGDEEVVAVFESRGPENDFGWAAIEGVRTDRWKFTARPDPVELYDVVADRHEQRNLAQQRPDVRDDLQLLFDEHRAQRARPGRAERRNKMDLDELEQLAALGYISAPHEFAPEEAPDPRRFAGVSSWVDRARGLAKQGQFDEAINALETLEAVPAVRALVLRSLGDIYAGAGRFDDAADAFGHYLELSGAAEAQMGLARALIRAERLEEALDALGPQSRENPTKELLRARILSRLGRAEAARAAVDWQFPGRDLQRRRLREHAILILDAAPQPGDTARLRELVKLAPRDPLLSSRLGFHLAIYGDEAHQEEAVRLLRESAEREPDDPEIRSNLGWSLNELGRYAEAVDELNAATQLDPHNHKTSMKLAIALGRAGERKRALTLAESILTLRPAAPWSDDAKEFIAETETELASMSEGSSP